MSDNSQPNEEAINPATLKEELVDWCLDLGYVNLACRISRAPVAILREIVYEDVEDADDFLHLMGY